MLAVVLTYFSRLNSFETHIKNHETKTWESLGKPGGLIKDSFYPVGVIKIFIFLYKGRYEEFSDPVAKQKAISLKNTITLFLIMFIGLLVFTMLPYIKYAFA